MEHVDWWTLQEFERLHGRVKVSMRYTEDWNPYMDGCFFEDGTFVRIYKSLEKTPPYVVLSHKEEYAVRKFHNGYCLFKDQVISFNV